MRYAADTRAVHAGRHHLAQAGVHVPSVDLSSTYPIADFEQAVASLGAFADGEEIAANPVYGRLFNSTVAAFEDAVAELEGASEAVAFSSGMAAITALLLAVRMRGARHVIAIRPLYGGTDHLLASALTGLEVSWCTEADAAAAVRPDTGLVILETPANPTMQLADIRALAQGVAPVPVLVDSTFATPVLQQPLRWGAAAVVHSATKFLGGHGDAIGGVVATSQEWARPLRQARIATGALLHPWGAYLLHRGLQTLPLRMERAQSNARILAERLVAHPAVARVYYPELDPRFFALAHQMSGPGSMIGFETVGGREAAAQVMASVRLITAAVSLGSVDSLIQHPAGLTHQVAGEEARRSGGVSDALLRISVGIEGVDDLWEDLRGALHQCHPVDVEPGARVSAG